MVLGIAHDRHAPATRFHFVAFGDALGGVIGALSVKVGTDFADDGAHIVLGENHNCVHVGEGREYFRALLGRHQWTPCSLKSAHGIVGVDRHHELAAQFTRGAQVPHMSNMEQIEASVGERNASAGAPPFAHTLPELVARDNLLMGGCAQCGRVTGAE